jgi:phosphate/sulfate permease
MGDAYILMIVALIGLAALDLVVGVSNDAVNFLNSAIGSKVISMRTILIVASIGIAIGAVFSSGMMEVARKGIFNPGEFYFNEIMIIFMAVMVTDILLLDFFNTLGMPTSTTVSIVFELLGASVAMGIIKILVSDDQTLLDLPAYINTSQAGLIISGIFLSVVFAFSIGALVQFLSRVFMTFDFDRKPIIYSALFSGFALTSITFFIFMKGLQGTNYYGQIKSAVEANQGLIIVISFIVWSVLSYLLATVLKFNIYKLIISVGTFALALAFAGNDLVNFIGVPMAAWNSYLAWGASGEAAEAFNMGVLAGEVPTPALFLLIAGLIMVVTLWFSSKARKVAATEVNLARQAEGHERFEPNVLSRMIVRSSIGAIRNTGLILPDSWKKRIERKFQKPSILISRKKMYEMPAFDAVRASTNLMVAGVLISIATSFKLPLSTTYVTFMVAMGTSLADRAWDRESAVYRVAGVLNVIGGWFFTAIVAFFAAGLIAYVIHLGGMVAISIILIVVGIQLARNYVRHRKEEVESAQQRIIQHVEVVTAKEVMKETSDHIADVVARVQGLYSSVIKDLASHDLGKLRKTEKKVNKMNARVDELKDNAFYFIRSMDESTIASSRFYLLVIGYLQDMTQSIGYISKASFDHVNNNHKNLKKSQIKDLLSINESLSMLLTEISRSFSERQFDSLMQITAQKDDLFQAVTDSIQKQVNRIRTEESSAKNTTLYFSNLLETKDLIEAIMNLLELYQEFQVSIKKSYVSPV